MAKQQVIVSKLKLVEYLMQSKEVKDLEKQGLSIQQAQNQYKIGILEVNSQKLNKEKEVLELKDKLKTLENKLQTSIYTLPVNIQSIINNRKDIIILENKLKDLIEEYKYYEDTLTYLQDLESTLF